MTVLLIVIAIAIKMNINDLRIKMLSSNIDLVSTATVFYTFDM